MPVTSRCTHALVRNLLLGPCECRAVFTGVSIFIKVTHEKAFYIISN